MSDFWESGIWIQLNWVTCIMVPHSVQSRCWLGLQVPKHSKESTRKKIHFRLTHVLSGFQAVSQSVPQFAMWVFSRAVYNTEQFASWKQAEERVRNGSQPSVTLISVVPLTLVLFYSLEKTHGYKLSLRFPQGPEYLGVMMLGGLFRNCLSTWSLKYSVLPALELGFKKNWTILCQTI